MKTTSVRAVAEFFGVSSQSVHAWLKRGCPRHGDPAAGYSYDIAEIARWYVANLGRGRAENDDPGRRKLTAEAERAETRAKREREELIPRAEHLTKLWSVTRTIRDTLRVLPDEVSRELGPAATPNVLRAVQHSLDRAFEILAGQEPSPAPAPAEKVEGHASHASNHHESDEDS